MQLIARYKNGNYTVQVYNDGTKIRVLDEGEENFLPEFPENIDLKISNRCGIGCRYCHEGCTPKGSIAALHSFSVEQFLSSLHGGTELAIGGGALSQISNDLFDFMIKARERNIITNITVNAVELLYDSFFYNLFLHMNVFGETNKKYYYRFIHFLSAHPDIFQQLENRKMVRCINGLGISYNSDPECQKRMLLLKRAFPNNIVIHTIYGITTKSDYDWLAENGFKVLVLGYKEFRRGQDYMHENYSKIHANMTNFDKALPEFLKKFKYLSFDCLATEQIKLKEKIPPEIWNARYMGDDGSFTMYVDLVNYNFGVNSTTPHSERKSMQKYKNNSSLMFKAIQNKKL